MSKYKTVIELPAAEVALLDTLVASPSALSYEDFDRIEQGCKKAWCYGFGEDDGSLDMYLSTKFENSMLLDLIFSREAYAENGGYFGDITLGDSDEVFVRGLEDAVCHPKPEAKLETVVGIYTIDYEGDTYETEVRKAA